MDISTDLDFAADPATVYAMMLDRGYQEQVCEASESRRSAIEITPPRTWTSRALEAPDSAARFTGPELTILEETTWGPAAADGSREADLVLTVERQPVALRGRLRMTPGGRGTSIRLTGELKVNVPLLGKKLEQAAAPAVLAGFRTQQSAGDRWLAEHQDA
jgi:Protein of unknown function (DUF2505)